MRWGWRRRSEAINVRGKPESVILIEQTIGSHDQDEFNFLSIQPAQINVNRVVLALINLVPMAERFYVSISDLIIEPEDYVAGIRFVLAIDPRLESVSIAHFEGWILALDQTIVGILRNGEQAGLILGIPVFHDGMLQLDYIALGRAF